MHAISRYSQPCWQDAYHRLNNAPFLPQPLLLSGKSFIQVYIHLLFSRTPYNVRFLRPFKSYNTHPSDSTSLQYCQHQTDSPPVSAALTLKGRSVSSIRLSVDKHPGARHEQKYENTALYATDSLLSLSNPYFVLVISLKAIGARGRIASAIFIGMPTIKTAFYAPSRDLTGLTPRGWVLLNMLIELRMWLTIRPRVLHEVRQDLHEVSQDNVTPPGKDLCCTLSKKCCRNVEHHLATK
jgi:hypothetical protein